MPGVIQIGRSEYGERGETRPFILSLQAYILLVVRRLSSPRAPCEEEIWRAGEKERPGAQPAPFPLNPGLGAGPINGEAG